MGERFGPSPGVRESAGSAMARSDGELPLLMFLCRRDCGVAVNDEGADAADVGAREEKVTLGGGGIVTGEAVRVDIVLTVPRRSRSRSSGRCRGEVRL